MTTWPDGSGGQVTTAGTYTWTVPSGCYTVTVQLWGGGGGGGGGGGAGGGGGGYASSVESVAGDGATSYTIVVGAGGSAGPASSASSGGTGGKSTWQSTTIVAAGGLPATGAGAGTGGYSNTGGTHFSGGNGGDGFSSGKFISGGGGGGAAGPAGNGGNGGNATTTSAGGAGGGPDGTGSGYGGAGGSDASAGSNGTVAGGAGGGGGFLDVGGTDTFYAGGAGAAGGGELTWPTIYTVTFNSNGGSGSMSNELSNISKALTTNTFTRSGYTFLDWQSTAGSIYTDGSTYNFPSGGNTTMTAQWTQYIVTFNANGGFGSAIQGYVGTTTLSAFSTLGINFYGRRFKGWNTVANGTGTEYADQASYNFTGNATLYAQWETNSTLMTMGFA